MNRFLFSASDFLSRPRSFYILVIAIVLCMPHASRLSEGRAWLFQRVGAALEVA